MFKFLYNKLLFAISKNENVSSSIIKEEVKEKISSDIKENIKNLKNIFGISSDIIFRQFTFGKKEKINAVLIFLDGITEKTIINDTIIRPLMYDSRVHEMDEYLQIGNINKIKNEMLSVSEVKNTSAINEIVDGVLSGDTIFLIDQCNEALIINCRDWETRGIEDPKTEAVVRGSREGFCENININLTLLRRRIKNHNLNFETMNIGKQTRTSVSIAYLKGVVNPKLIGEIKERLNRINTDSILESGYIEQFIEDAPSSIFPTIGNSEKPDIIAAKVLEGRVAIFVDGTPFVLTVPMLFVEGFQSAEDYYSRTYYSSILRLIRYLGFFINVFAPASYVIFTTFHQELIPTTLIFSLAASREGVPFPAVLEAGLMILTFEILREAGVRLPRPVGQAVSIVGALVIGEAAVTAGLVSGLMVIVVAITAVSSFIVPVYTDVGGILRWVFLILGGVLGIFGLTIGMLAVLVHMVSVRSFGAPYLSPFAPLTIDNLKDTFIREPLWKMFKRPRVIGWHNPIKQKRGLKPTPSKGERKNK